ncbi:MAG: D-alanine--D-alanine ligase [Flavobacteriaceae bacterium]|nr:D-alanine--D-alanine ligase [Bacteroidia bacterium]MBT8289095.1 D-alanine--D-alanine ligase [Bacteroidia bacterium]NNF74959.1 D-alanine--D-alanine ligase [Flavobacteriaceae bacterium]NNK71940.1 D-alanine--D-alanine ligase [Flavobacteriaceae bacterium]
MKLKIAIIMGGFSSEYKISLKSGNVVFNSLNRDKYEPYRIHIFKDKWVYVNEAEKEFPIDKNDFSISLHGKKISFDCVFNAIHGSPGEDGYMQSYFHLIGLPQTGCNMYQAALTFNKRDCLSVLKPYGIKMASSYYLNQGDRIDENAIVDAVGLPCFVKANKAGSSFGITKVYKREELQGAITHAFEEDDEILIEEFLDGTEVSVGVIVYRGEIKVLPITEIVSDNDFFDYKAKYLGESQEITPARIDDSMARKVRIVAKKVYEILRMSGFSRSEYIFKNEEPHLLEINTVPGLTKESILPQQAAADGISLEELFDNAITEALK